MDAGNVQSLISSSLNERNIMVKEKKIAEVSFPDIQLSLDPKSELIDFGAFTVLSIIREGSLFSIKARFVGRTVDEAIDSLKKYLISQDVILSVGEPYVVWCN